MYVHVLPFALSLAHLPFASCLLACSGVVRTATTVKPYHIVTNFNNELRKAASDWLNSAVAAGCWLLLAASCSWLLAGGAR